VQGGQTSATFTVTPLSVSQTTSSLISATLGTVTKSVTLTVQDSVPPTVSFDFNTLLLTVTDPSGLQFVTLSGSNFRFGDGTFPPRSWNFPAPPNPGSTTTFQVQIVVIDPFQSTVIHYDTADWLGNRITSQ
jgi:hypothetical protein